MDEEVMISCLCSTILIPWKQRMRVIKWEAEANEFGTKARVVLV
jgi:hypothetical protein